MTSFNERQRQRILATYGKVGNTLLSKSENSDLHNENNYLEKGGKHGMVGEVRTRKDGKKFKKQANGKWMEISESHGLTFHEHRDKKLSNDKRISYAKRGVDSNGKFIDTAAELRDENLKHSQAIHKLSDKEHTDEEVGLGEEKDSKVLGHTRSGKPIYQDNKDPHQFMGIHSRNPNHGSKSRKLSSALKRLSDDDLQKFYEHHKEHGKHYLSNDEESKKRREYDKKNNPSDRSGYTDQSDDDASHWEAMKQSAEHIQKRKDGGEADRRFRVDSRRDRNTPR